MRTRLLVCLSLCFLTTPLFAQSEAGDGTSPSTDFETLVVKRGTSVWFGKTKNTILDYAAVTTKTGIVETDHRTNRDYEEDTTRYKLSVLVDATDSSTANVAAEVSDTTQYQETSSALDILVEVGTGIEGSSTRHLHSQKTLSATIKTSLNENTEWTLRWETEIDNANSIRRREGSIDHNDRSIDIIEKHSPVTADEPTASSRIEFIENGQWLGAIGDSAYLFATGLDPELKLVLAAAMEAISFRYLH